MCFIRLLGDSILTILLALSQRFKFTRINLHIPQVTNENTRILHNCPYQCTQFALIR